MTRIRARRKRPQTLIDVLLPSSSDGSSSPCDASHCSRSGCGEPDAWRPHHRWVTVPSPGRGSIEQFAGTATAPGERMAYRLLPLLLAAGCLASIDTPTPELVGNRADLIRTEYTSH